MTVPSTASEISYAGDGVTLAFPIPFVFETSSDLKVTSTSTAGDVTTLTSGFSASGGSGSTGTLTFLVAPASTVTITILDDPVRSQDTDYTANDAFPAEAHERALDKETRLSKRLYQLIRRCIRTADGDPISNMELGSVTVRKGKYLFFNVVTGAIEYAALVAGTITQSIIGQLLYPQTPEESGAGITPTNYQYPAGHVLRYKSNTTPGTTDMTSAFQTASLVSLNPYAPSGVYLITGSTALRDFQAWVLDGAQINITGTSVQVFTAAAGIDDWSITGEWVVTGDNGAAGATTGSAAALKIVDCSRFRVEGLVAKNIKGWGILAQPGSSTSNRAEHGQIISPQMYACYIGIEIQAGSGAEYISVVAPNITRCNTGMIVAAGNANVSGGSIVDNTTGVTIQNGTNHAHGIFNGVNINHNTAGGTGFGLQCSQVLNGQSFLNCHFYENTVFFDKSKGIHIDGGVIDCPVYNYKDGSSGENFIRNMYCPAGYGFERYLGTNNGHDQLIITDCYGPGIYASGLGAVDVAGTPINDVSTVHASAKRLNAVNQSLTSGVAATLIFPTEIFDRRLAYDNTTGIFTVPTNRSGLYRIRSSCIFSGTAMSSTSSILELVINASSPRLALPTINSTTRLRIVFDEEISLAAGDTVKLRATITGTTPVFGDSQWESYLSIERVA